MPYNESLAQRVREQLLPQEFTEKKMFGGLCFLVDGNMCCGIVGNELMLRVGPDLYHETLKMKHTRLMDFTGKPMKGMVYVEEEGLLRNDQIRQWILLALKFTLSLEAK